ncbi:MAG: YfhO family protein [Calditrichaeota bacterium]|nr:YfhO family protein [Calditrichota bacterium]
MTTKSFPPPREPLSIGAIWDRCRRDLPAIGGVYLLLALFFAPVIFEGKGLSPAADMVASAGMYRMGEEAIAGGRFPLWNPTLFCGLPMFASLQYALFVYPPEYVIRALSFVFGSSDYRIWLFHYLIAATLAYLLARHFGAGRAAAWLAGAAFGYSPQLIVLADVGHGSKLMAMTWLPLIYLLMDRLRLRPTPGRAAALGLAFAVQVLALHPQVAAYGALLMGVYILYHLAAGFIGKERTPLPVKLLGWWSGAMVIALGVSAILWVSVLDYARFSMRGAAAAATGATGGGVSWDYATGWSFHPIESITYFFPGFFGFGNETYWGTVGTPDGTPFTHNPMYFGVTVLFLAVIGMILRPKRIWGPLLTLALVAWVLSFGRYLPVLYGPFYHLLPLFNKFRAPVMGQVLLLLPMTALAGIGLQALLEQLKGDSGRFKSPGSTTVRPLLPKILTILAVIAGAKIFLMLLSDGLFRSIYTGLARIIQPKANPQVLAAALEVARSDALVQLLLIGLLCLLTALAWRRKVAALPFTIAICALFLLDLYLVDRKLVTFTPRGTKSDIFRAEGVASHLLKQPGYFRLHPLDTRYRAANWWSYHGIATTNGYFGAKMANYQAFMNEFGIDATPPHNWLTLHRRPQVLDALNVRYIISSYPLEQIFEELKRQGQGDPVRPASAYLLEVVGRDVRPGAGPFVYRNPGELPRARLTGEFQVIPDLTATYAAMQGRTWDPRALTLVDRKPVPEPIPGAPGRAEIVSFTNERIEISTAADDPRLLVLAETYYPSGWTATINGKDAEILRADGVLRAVALPAGEHKVVFTFRPRLFYAGLTVSLITLFAIAGLGIGVIVRRRRS